MQDVSDFDLQKDDDLPPPAPEARSRTPWIVAAAVMVAVAGAAWLYFSSRGTQTTPTPAQAKPAAQAPTTSPLGGSGDAIELPPLDQTDTLVRQLVKALSSHQVVAAWLATDGLLRSFTVAVDNIAGGTLPPPRLISPIRPAGRFRAIDGDDDLLIDPRSYDRYAPFAAAVDSLDAEGVARLYSTLKPRIEDAYAEFGRQRSFDVALEEAMVTLLRTPAVQGDVRLAPKGGVFAFDDPRLERLSPAQKQLARMGPRNVRVIQGKLREISLALGIPAERLPR